MATKVKPEGAAGWRHLRGAMIAATVTACWFAWPAGAAYAQNSGVESQAPAPQSAPVAPAAPPNKQGFIAAFGSWMQDSVSTVGAGLGAVVDALGGQASKGAKGAADAASTVAKSAADVAKGAADAARDTATTVSRLPGSNFVSGRERCLLAPNGAPDCRVAAEAMCRAKGYDSGTSVDFITSENCPPSYRVTSRDTSSELGCPLEHFVTRALCQ